MLAYDGFQERPNESFRQKENVNLTVLNDPNFPTFEKRSASRVFNFGTLFTFNVQYLPSHYHPLSLRHHHSLFRKVTEKRPQVQYSDMMCSVSQEKNAVVSLLRLSLEQKKHDVVKKQDKHVRFSNIEIREYALVEGDHPYCVDGLALSLDWRYAPQTTVKNVLLEDKECAGKPRRLGYVDRRMRLQQAS